MTREDMAKGLALLSTAFGRQLTGELVEVYHGVVGPRLDAPQWERAVRRVLEAESFFPPPAVLLRYGLAGGLPEARAVEVYDRIVGDFESGREAGPRDIREQYGTAAAEAFCAAGGTRAFAWCEPRDEPFRRKAFVEGWVETVGQDPWYALPAAPATALPEGEPLRKCDGDHALVTPCADPECWQRDDEPPSRDEATSILARIAERVGR
jgi:hypothetical protein